MPDDDLSSFIHPCPRCRQPIVAAHRCDGVLLPLDAIPAPAGTVLVCRDPQHPHRLCGTVIDSSAVRRRLARGGWPLYHHHHVTCSRPERRPAPLRAPAVSTADRVGLF